MSAIDEVDDGQSSPYPKIELHVHLEGAIRPATLFDLALKNKVALPVTTLAELETFYEFRDFSHFIDVWNVTTNVVFDADDFRRIVVEYAREAATHGAVYVEAIFSPSQYYVRQISGDALFEGFTNGIQDALEQTGVVVRLTPDIDRGRLPMQLAERIVDDSIRYRDRGIVGVGLGGRERSAPTSDYAALFQKVRDNGLAAVPHAGEDAGASSVREAIDILGAHRIRHGFRAVEDPRLLVELQERGIVLDLCPTSNLRTKVADTWDAHPFHDLLASGVGLTVNTDDPAMFGTDLGVEHRLARSAGADPRQLFEWGITGQAGGEAVATELRRIAIEHWGEASPTASEPTGARPASPRPASTPQATAEAAL